VSGVRGAAPRRVRVLHVVLDLDQGGLERLVPDIVRRLSPERFEAHVLALKFLGRNAAGLEAYGGLHVAAPMPRWSMIWPRGLTRQIGALAPDVVHTHSGVWYKASLAARRASVHRLVHTDHGRQRPDPWSARFFDGRAARRTDVVVAVSEVLARQLERTVVRDASRVVVVPNGVDTQLFRPRPDSGTVRAELGIPAEAPVIGSVGRLDPIKAYDVMIEAFARLLANWNARPRPALVLAGDGPERGRLEALVRARGLGASARLVGWRDDVHDLYATFTLFTLSSWSEGTSLSLLEAMSAGLCPVVTDVGGTPAVLGDRLRHRLVPPRQPDALAAAWRAALDDAGRRRDDAALARSRVEEAFGLDAMVRRYEAIYLGEV
jgi:glycosyltransferase involved in cell wall biosynthesis